MFSKIMVCIHWHTCSVDVMFLFFELNFDWVILSDLTRISVCAKKKMRIHARNRKKQEKDKFEISKLILSAI